MLNENIKALRKAKGLSQEELAIKLNVVRQTVSKWEKALSVPDAGMLIKIADALDTTVNVLLDKEAPEKGEQEPTKAIAAKLELLNEQFAKRSERNRKIWRIVFVAIGLVALAGIVNKLSLLFEMLRVNSSTPIIGGADAATQMYVTGSSSHWTGLIITILAGIVAVIGIHHTRRK